MSGSVYMRYKLLDPLSLVCTLFDFNARLTNTFTNAPIAFSLYCTHKCGPCKRSEKCCQPAAVCDVSECTISWWVMSRVMFCHVRWVFLLHSWLIVREAYVVCWVLVILSKCCRPICTSLYESHVRISLNKFIACNCLFVWLRKQDIWGWQMLRLHQQTLEQMAKLWSVL